jgi:hypothetical protein
LVRARFFVSQKTELKFEVEETVVLRQGGKIARDYCPKCCQAVDMVSPDVLALVMGASEREIFRLVEAGMIYFVEADRLMICNCCYRRMPSGNRTAAASDGF